MNEVDYKIGLGRHLLTVLDWHVSYGLNRSAVSLLNWIKATEDLHGYGLLLRSATQ